MSKGVNDRSPCGLGFPLVNVDVELEDTGKSDGQHVRRKSSPVSCYSGIM